MFDEDVLQDHGGAHGDIAGELVRVPVLGLADEAGTEPSLLPALLALVDQLGLDPADHAAGGSWGLGDRRRGLQGG